MHDIFLKFYLLKKAKILLYESLINISLASCRTENLIVNKIFFIYGGVQQKNAYICITKNLF